MKSHSASKKEANSQPPHINSYSRGSLGDRSPYEVFGFLYGTDVLNRLGCRRIRPNDVTLDSSNLKEVDVR